MSSTESNSKDVKEKVNILVPSTDLKKSESQTGTNVSSKHKTTLGSRSSHYFRSGSNVSLDSIQGLDRLINEEHLFIRRTKNEFDADYIDSSHIYDILNSSGDRIFSAVKTFHYENCDRLLELDICILECEGGGVLSIKGDSASISVCTLTFSGDLQDELGIILNHKDGCCTEQDLEIKFQDKVQFQITQTPGHGKRKGNFDIVWTEGHVPCGRVSVDWTNWFEETNPITLNSYYGIGFSIGMDVRAKALLMAVMIYLYFENFDLNGELRRGSFTFDRICCLIFGILFAITMIFLTTVAIIRAAYPEF